MTSKITVNAHAKVNLELRVVGVRPDGFHDLETVFQTLELHDTLDVERREGPFTLSCEAPGVPLDATNLVARAASVLWRRLGRDGAPAGVAVRLVKRIPAEAGLGGGSADAAAALVVLSRLWNAALGADALAEVAAEVGSDVPFFLVGGAAVGRGRGERLVALPDGPSRWVVLARPPFGISTAAAYGWYDAEAAGAGSPAGPPLGPGWAVPAGSIRNDLEAPVFRRHPEIGGAKAALAAAGAVTVGLSGSGSAVFGLFDDHVAARRAETALAGTGPGWRTWLTRTLGRAGAELRLAGAWGIV